MINISNTPYEAPSVVVRTILPPQVLCISGDEFTGKSVGYDNDSD